MSNGMTVQVVAHETGKEDGVSWTRIDVANQRGRFPVKFKGAKAEHLTRDMMATLASGETIQSKRLFVELSGEWVSFTRPNSTFKVRYFKADDYKLIDGPSLALARLRGQAAEALEQSEALRNAGAVGPAYKVLAAYLAEIAQIPLDLSEISGLDDALIGKISDEEYDAEAAAARHFAREDAAAQAMVAAEDDEILIAPAADVSVDIDDDIPLSVVSEEDLSGEASAEMEIDLGDVDQDFNETSEGDNDDDDERDEAVVSEEVEVVQTPAPTPARRQFGFPRGR